MHLTPHFDDDTFNPEEDAALRSIVARTLVSCPATTIQTAVTTAALVYQQDWRREAYYLLQEFGLPTCTTSVMRASTATPA